MADYDAINNGVATPDDAKYITTTGAETSPLIEPDADLSPTEWELTGSSHYGALTNGDDTEYITAEGASEETAWEHSRGSTEYDGDLSPNWPNWPNMMLLQEVDDSFTCTEVQARVWLTDSDFDVEWKCFKHSGASPVGDPTSGSLTLIGSGTIAGADFNSDTDAFQTFELTTSTSISSGDFVELYMVTDPQTTGSEFQIRAFNTNGGYGDRYYYYFTNTTPPWTVAWGSAGLPYYDYSTALKFINKTSFSGVDHLQLGNSPADTDSVKVIRVSGRGRWNGQDGEDHHITAKFYHTGGTILVGTATLNVDALTENTWGDIAAVEITGLSLTKTQADGLSVKLESVIPAEVGDSVDLSDLDVYLEYTQSDAEVEHLGLGDSPADVLTVTSIKARARAAWGGAGSGNTFTAKLYHTSGTVLVGTFTFELSGTEDTFANTGWETVSSLTLTKAQADDLSVKLEGSGLGADPEELVKVSEIEFVYTYIVDQSDYEKDMGAESGTEKTMEAVVA